MQPIDWPERTYLLIDGDTEIGPGFEVLLAPDHAPGQLALALELPGTGPILITGDALSRPSEPVEGFNGASDEAAAAVSAERLLAIAAARDAWLIYGHCPAQWPTLKKAPEQYI